MKTGFILISHRDPPTKRLRHPDNGGFQPRGGQPFAGGGGEDAFPQIPPRALAEPGSGFIRRIVDDELVHFFGIGINEPSLEDFFGLIGQLIYNFLGSVKRR